MLGNTYIIQTQQHHLLIHSYAPWCLSSLPVHLQNIIYSVLFMFPLNTSYKAFLNDTLHIVGMAQTYGTGCQASWPRLFLKVLCGLCNVRAAQRKITKKKNHSSVSQQILCFPLNCVSVITSLCSHTVEYHHGCGRTGCLFLRDFRFYFYFFFHLHRRKFFQFRKSEQGSLLKSSVVSGTLRKNLFGCRRNHHSLETLSKTC